MQRINLVTLDGGGLFVPKTKKTERLRGATFWRRAVKIYATFLVFTATDAGNA
jgi:hypothetical protein